MTSEHIFFSMGVVSLAAIIIVPSVYEGNKSNILISGSPSNPNVIVDLPEEWEAITKDTLICTRRGNTLIFEFKH